MGVGSATLGPGLGGLWAFADPLAKRLLIRQLVILGLLRIAPLRRLRSALHCAACVIGASARAMRIQNRWVCHLVGTHDTAIKHKLATARGALPHPPLPGPLSPTELEHLAKEQLQRVHQRAQVHLRSIQVSSSVEGRQG